MELRKFNQSPNDSAQNEKSENQFINIKPLSSNDVKTMFDEIRATNKNKPNIHQGHRERLKSQYLENGLNSLTDIQKLELLLFFAIPQKDTNPLAHNLLNHFGSLKNVFLASHDELMQVDGIKNNSALLINLANSFVNYCHKPDENEIMDSTKAFLQFAEKLFYGVDVEQFYVICLNKSGKVKKYSLIASGTDDEVNIQIRDITKLAIDNKVNRILICHNHPHGIPKPSSEDIKLTYSIICSCILNNIDVLDHIIVGENDVLSFDEAMIMPKLRKKAVENVQISKEFEMFMSASNQEYKRSKVVHIDF